MLVDTGLGSWAQGRGTEFLLDGLAARGVAPEAVDRVVLSHLHFDHSGGAISPVGADWRPTFPDADYVVQRAETTASGYAGESVRARDLVLETLDREGQLVWVEGDTEIGRVGLEGDRRAHRRPPDRPPALGRAPGHLRRRRPRHAGQRRAPLPGQVRCRRRGLPAVARPAGGGGGPRTGTCSCSTTRRRARPRSSPRARAASTSSSRSRCSRLQDTRRSRRRALCYPRGR